MESDEKFQFFLAKLFGDLLIAKEEGVQLTAFLWRDHIYVVDLSYSTPASKNI